jgi:hypothetical protein
MSKFFVFAFLATASIAAMTIAPASAYTSSGAGGIEVASLVSSASATTLAFNPQPDPPGRADGDGFDNG